MVNLYLKKHYDKTKRPITNYPEVFANYLIKKINLNADSTFIELGCGRGEFTNALYKKKINIIACDQLPKSEILEKNIQFFKFNFSKDIFPFKDNSVDVIFHKSVIEHIDNYDFFISEQKRILKKEGLIFFLTPNWKNQLSTFYDDPTHVKPYSLEGAKLLMEIYNFEVLNNEIFFHHRFFFEKKNLTKIFYFISKIISYKFGRILTSLTKIQFFRWCLESQILIIAKKK